MWILEPLNLTFRKVKNNCIIKNYALSLQLIKEN